MAHPDVHVRLIVTDTGPLITLAAADRLEHVFARAEHAGRHASRRTVLAAQHARAHAAVAALLARPPASV